MKKGWEYKELGELCHKFNGLWKGKKAPFVRVGVIRNANFTKAFTLDFSNIEYLDVEEKQYASRKLQLGDLIVEKSGGSEKQPVGRAVLFQEKEGEYSFSNFTSVLRVKDNHEITPEFLYKYILHVYLRGDTRKMQKATTGIHNIEFDKYLAIKIPVPPLSEQKEIVEYLDSSFAKIDKLKENAAKNLEEAKALFQSALNDALEPKEGWEEKTMDEVCILSQGLAINSKTKHLLVEKSSIPLLRIKDMQDGTREIFVDDKNYPPKCLAHPDELIYTRTGTLGLIFTGMFGIVHNNCFKIKLDEKILNKYYYMYFVGSDNFRNMILSIASRAAQPDITHKLFKVQKIQFPTLSEQQSIVSFLDSLNEKVNTLQQNYSRICDECDALKQAILRQVFE